MKLDDRTRRAVDRAWNCRLITVGRKSGEPRRVTIWFALDGDEVVLAGGPDGPHWYRNLKACEDVELQIGRYRLHGRARAIEDEADAESVRKCFVRRYLAARLSRPFGGYTRSVTVRVAIDRAERVNAY
jgi:deazaflavin-dependent oxidoreductase (nitroreductase family)